MAVQAVMVGEDRLGPSGIDFVSAVWNAPGVVKEVRLKRQGRIIASCFHKISCCRGALPLEKEATVRGEQQKRILTSP